MTGSVHSVLLKLASCFLKSSALTETGGNLMDQGQGYSEDASTHCPCPCFDRDLFRTFSISRNELLKKWFGIVMFQPRIANGNTLH